MRMPLLEVSTLVIFILALFSLLNISEAIPVRDGILGIGGESELWHDIVVRQFYGPWSSDGDKLNTDYNDYEAHVEDFEPGPEDEAEYEPEVADAAGTADFQSNYGEFEGDEFAAGPFQPPSGNDQSVGNQDEGDEIAGGDPENHDLEGNVQWTSAAT